MPKSINRIEIGGHLGRDAETRHTHAGDSITTLSIATTDGWGDSKSTSWHKVVLFKKLGEWSADAQKGDYVWVSGSMRDNNWTAKDGSKRYNKQILGNEYINFSRSGDGSGGRRPPKDPMEPMGERKATTDDFDDEIPF